MKTNKSSRVMHMAHIFARQGMNKSYALTWAWHMETLRKGMRNGIVRFRFIKKDGSIRDAKGTTNLVLIPSDKWPKGEEQSQRQRQSQCQTINYFDLDRNDWRSFRITDFEDILEAYAITEVML